MPKNIDDVIIKERKRSIRDIPIPEGRHKMSETYVHPLSSEKKSTVIHTIEDTVAPPPPPTKVPHSFSRVSSPNKKFWLALVFGALVVMFSLLSYFDGATLSYLPKSQQLSFVNEAYVAYRTGEQAPLYSITKISLDDSAVVPASGEREVSRKASGNIVVYNNTTASIRLIATTRFETTSGLVYRIEDAIVVPARRTVNGVAQPGSLEVTVYADEPGENYNTGLADFVLPGLRDTANFESVYARSKTPMSGGFVGMEKIVSETDLESAKNGLESSLRAKLAEEASASIPSDFVLIPALSSFVFEEMPQTAGTSANNVTVNMRGHLNGVMFKRSDISTSLAMKKMNIESGQSVDLDGLEDLTFSYIGLAPRDPLQATEINFTVTGEARALFRTDEVALKSDLLGRHKSELPSVLNRYSSIEEANVTLKPFWKTSFPEKVEDIQIRKLPVQ